MEGIGDEVNHFLRGLGYKPMQTFKNVADYAVILVAKGSRKYVAKIAAKRAWPLIQNEIAAIKYLRRRKVPGVPALARVVRRGQFRGFIEEYAEGRLLVEYQNEPMSERWWAELLKQLVAFIGALEAERVLHNDFWDANVIVGPGPKITVLDYQYTHQYRRRPRVYSAAVASRKRLHQAEKERLGWSSKWHSGGDLNQMLGLLSDYESMPAKYRDYIKAHVAHAPKADFPYATTQSNSYFSPAVLSRLWFDPCETPKTPRQRMAPAARK